MERIGIIDIGTHSVLYLLTQRNEDGTIVCLDQALRSVGLGKSITKTECIAQDRITEAARTVEDFSAKAKRDGAHQCIAVGTQVFRVAQNRQEALDVIVRTSGIAVEVLSPEDEALWSCKGALYGREQSDSAVVVDIGGGSTEIIAVKPDAPPSLISLPIGAVVLTERFLHHDPHARAEEEALVKSARTAFNDKAEQLISSAKKLIAVGGTITTLAALHLQLAQYDSARVDGLILSDGQIKTLFHKLKVLNLDERTAFMKVDPQRAEIILAGTMIMLEVMRTGRFTSVLVSDRGLRFGIALRTFQMA